MTPFSAVALTSMSNEDKFYGMKTTIDIPNKLMEDALLYSGSRTKREIVVCALEEYNRRHRMARLSKSFGKCNRFMTVSELQKMRKDS